MILKNIIGTAAAAVTAAALSLSAFAADGSGFRTESELVTAAKTPYDGKYTNIAWNTEQSDSAGVPVPLSDSVIFPVGNKVLKLAENTGEELGCAELTEKVSQNCRGAAAGKGLLQPTRTGLAMIDTGSMTVECYRSLGGNIFTDAAVIGDLGYIGVEFDGSYSFICVDMSGELETVWEYSSESPVTSPALFGDYVVFGAESSLVTHHYSSDGYTEISVGTEICGSPFAGEYAVYFSGSDGKSYKLRLNDDGTLEENTLISCDIGGELSSPVAWNGKLYVASSEGFYIIDSLNMEVITSLSDIKSGTDPIICYGNGPRVYLLYPEGDMWNFCCILDAEDTQPEVTLPARLETFVGGRLAVSAGGTMYFRDGIGRLYAAQVAPFNLLLIIVKLVVLLALIVLIFLILRYWAKTRNANRPPRYI
ncbi:MAG: hypothetical protein K2G32_00880 [Oscillospiraceae bacterium]|nr:hypothetical protein [Oscillospiraceae bacterium]